MSQTILNSIEQTISDSRQREWTDEEKRLKENLEFIIQESESIFPLGKNEGEPFSSSYEEDGNVDIPL